MVDVDIGKVAWVTLALLFISGCWTVGCILFTRAYGQFAGRLLMAASALANVSLLASVLSATLGMAGVVDEKRARMVMVATLILGVAFLMTSITTLCIVASTPPTPPTD